MFCVLFEDCVPKQPKKYLMNIFVLLFLQVNELVFLFIIIALEQSVRTMGEHCKIEEKFEKFLSKLLIVLRKITSHITQCHP